jgi:tetratricopeptide (TPR) repeat protein
MNAKASHEKPVNFSLSPQELQLRRWNAAMSLFSQRQYGEAIISFREAMQGPEVHIADKARSYEQICIWQSAKAKVEFGTAEDHFTFGVERLNAHDFQQARMHLEKALELDPRGDHILYTIALCCGFAGDGHGACEHLRRAIEMEPGNRLMARQDSQFAAMVRQFPELRAIIGNVMQPRAHPEPRPDENAGRTMQEPGAPAKPTPAPPSYGATPLRAALHMMRRDQPRQV